MEPAEAAPSPLDVLALARPLLAALGPDAEEAALALGGADLAGAIAAAERAAATARGEALGALRLLQAEAHRWLGETAAARQRGAEAMDLLGPGSLPWLGAAVQVLSAAGTLGDAGAVLATVDAILERCPAPASAAHCVALARGARQATFLGRYDLTDTLLGHIDAAMAADPAAADDPAVTAQVHEVRALRARVAGDLEAALRHHEAALAGFERAGAEREACRERGNVGYSLAELGAFGEAARVLGEALALAERAGLRTVRTFVHHNLGLALARLGRLDEARAHEAAAIDLLPSQGQARLGSAAHAYMAIILLLGGDRAGAEREARQAVDMLPATAPLRATALARLAEVHLAEGRTAEACDAAQQALDIVTLLGGIEEGGTLVLLVHAEARRAAGDARGARRTIAEARETVEALAARIADPALRASFLGDVPENARILELWRALQPG